MRADARRNYERLVAAARQVFAEQGGGASMEAIAKEAGVGVGTLYRHFPKRIDVVEAVYRDDVDELVDCRRAARRRARAVGGPGRRGSRPSCATRSSKRTFLNELHEAFEKNPELQVGVPRAHRGSRRHRCSTGPRRPAWSATDVDGADLMQLLGSMCMSATLTPGQSERLLVVIEDGLRPPG